VGDVATGEITRQASWQRLGPLVRDVIKLAHRDFEERLRPLGLTRPQGAALKMLDPEGEGLPIVAMAQEMGCHSSNLTGLLDRLEARGLVRRATHPEDRRVKMVRLTQGGIELREQVITAFASAPSPFDALDDRDLHKLEAILERALARSGRQA
jgi:DNA-binding MarR family transcriptional regulator